MTEAAEVAYRSGQLAMVGFNYRRLPATALARNMVAEGRLGTLRHARVTYLQDWLVDPQFPLTWRLRKELAGSGSLGDLGAHIVDLAQYLAGETLAGVSALTETFVRERPLPVGATNGLSAVSSAGSDGHRRRRSPVHRRFTSGALASFEATRYATGRKNALLIELNGENGSLAFDLSASTNCRTTTVRSPERTPASAASSSPNPSTPTWTPGGRRGTASATSTASSTRPATSSTRSPRTATGTLLRRRTAGAARAGRGGGERREELRVHAHNHLRRVQRMPRQFTLFTGQWADLPLEESAAWPATSATTASNSPAGETTSRSTRPSRILRTSTQEATARQVRPQVLGRLQPPDRPGRVRRDHRPTPSGHPAGRGVG